MNKGREGRGRGKKAEHRVQLSVDGGEDFLFPLVSSSPNPLSLSSSPTLFLSLISLAEKEAGFEDRQHYVSALFSQFGKERERERVF